MESTTEGQKPLIDFKPIKSNKVVQGPQIAEKICGELEVHTKSKFKLIPTGRKTTINNTVFGSAIEVQPFIIQVVNNAYKELLKGCDMLVALGFHEN